MAQATSALWARVTDEVPAHPRGEAWRVALTRAEHERAELARSVRRLGEATEAWHEDARGQRVELERLQAQVAVINRRLQQTLAASEERQDHEGDALAVLHESSADLVDAVRSHTQRTLHELERLRDELREGSDRSAWRSRLAVVGCLAACAISVAAWVGGPGPANDATQASAAEVAPVGSTLLAGFRRAR
ncbi:MAG: hypothetical protein KDD82_20705 [Planctomycetes bacterium]|nr:hypothetical protein [Planctomycetota bacterium]